MLATRLQRGAFPAGQEVGARALWEQRRRRSVGFKLPSDPLWFASLLAAGGIGHAPSRASHTLLASPRGPRCTGCTTEMAAHPSLLSF